MVEIKLENILSVGIAAGIVGGAIFGVSCLAGAWGVRGTIDEYTSQYKGKPAIVQKNDVKWGPDTYHILLDGRDKITAGKIVTDDNKLIEIFGNSYSVKDYNPNKK